MRKSELVAPVLKWAGGKRQLLPEIEKYIPEFFTYYEPFAGGASVFFSIQPKKAVINDINPELINIYQVIRDNVEDLIDDLKKHKNEEGYFYKIRELDRNKEKYKRLTPVKRASRIIFLNKTCYNGLYRVNKSGEFNAPFGNYKNPNIVNEKVLRAVSNYLKKADITFLCRDFEQVLENIGEGSFVYIDPPYDPVSDSANFTSYVKGGFDREEQKRLKAVCDRLNRNGVKFLLSNSSTEFIRDLYKEYYIEIIHAKRAINSNPSKRGKVDEILVRNYK